MISNYTKLSKMERIIFDLRELYGRYGYKQYKMRKFEEYDLYSKNKDFLVSDSVITFTDTTGKLMALKPDVTLSIVKNSKDTLNEVQKLYYDEHVYRVARGSHSFKEIPQVGLESIGDIDLYGVSEVLTLAAKSLEGCFDNFVLEISSLDVLSAFLNYITTDVGIQREIIKCVGEKNLHGIDAICMTNDLDANAATPLKKLLSTYGEPYEVIDKATILANEIDASVQMETFANTVRAFLAAWKVYGHKDNSNIRIDFSVIDDMNYYNGLVFKGFVEGIPESILSGGQYDKLMNKLHRKSRAIGFAIYLDMLEYIDAVNEKYDVDIMLLYEDDTSDVLLQETVAGLVATGKTVFVTKSINKKVKYMRLAKIVAGEVSILEDNA